MRCTNSFEKELKGDKGDSTRKEKYSGSHLGGVQKPCRGTTYRAPTVYLT